MSALVAELLRFDSYRGPSSFDPERLNLLIKYTSFLNIRYNYTFLHYLKEVISLIL